MLTRDHSCIRSLAWSVELPLHVDLAEVARGLEGRGFALHRRVGALRVLRDADENEVALVLTTRRVQLRVSYLVPEHERRFVAERLYVELLKGLGLIPERVGR